MGLEWSKQKSEDLQEKRRKELLRDQKGPSGIALWSLENKETSKLVSQETSEEKKPIKCVKEETTNKHKSSSTKSEEDDDLIITQETIKKVVKPNSLEQQARFSAFYKFTPQWMEDLNSRREQKYADLRRQIEESEMTLKVASERRKASATVEDAVTRRFQMLDMKHPSARIEVSEEDDFPELTPEMEEIINDSLRKNPPGEVLTEKFNIQITRRDIATLSGLNWLNDEVINFYMNLLMERGRNDNYPSVYAFNTFFYPKLLKMGFSGIKRWTKKVDIFSHDLLLVPVHLGMHWCLATIDLTEKAIRYYDSMLGNNNECLQELRKYLQDEHLDKKKSPLDLSGWKLEMLKDIPQQMNGSDCGMFACKFSECLSRRKSINFTQDHMPYFRRRMVYEIVCNRLL